MDWSLQIVAIFSLELTKLDILLWKTTLQKRWENLRGSFARELQRQKKTKSGSGDGFRKIEHIFFKRLQFLRKVIAVRLSNSEEVSHDPDDSTVEEVQDLGCSDRQLGANVSRKKTQNQRRGEDPLIEALNRSVADREWHER